MALRKPYCSSVDAWPDVNLLLALVTLSIGEGAKREGGVNGAGYKGERAATEGTRNAQY